MENFEQPEKEAVGEKKEESKNLWDESLSRQAQTPENKQEENRPGDKPVEKKEENKPEDAPKGGESESGGKKAPEVEPTLPEVEAAYP